MREPLPRRVEHENTADSGQLRWASLQRSSYAGTTRSEKALAIEKARPPRITAVARALNASAFAARIWSARASTASTLS